MKTSPIFGFWGYVKLWLHYGVSQMMSGGGTPLGWVRIRLTKCTQAQGNWTSCSELESKKRVNLGFLLWLGPDCICITLIMSCVSVVSSFWGQQSVNSKSKSQASWNNVTEKSRARRCHPGEKCKGKLENFWCQSLTSECPTSVHESFRN